MKPSRRRFDIIGLILAILGAAATVILGLIKGVQLLGLFTPKTPQSINLPLEISAGVLILGLALYALLAPDKVRAFLTGRQARYGSNALILSLAFVGILSVINVLTYQHPREFDLTEGKQHTLAPETIKMLNTLPQKVTATAFFSSRLSTDTARQLLMDFQSSSNDKFGFSFVDPDLNPVQARNAGITGDGKILLQMGDQQEIASQANEQEIDKALLRLINPETRVIYFLTGNGEPDINGTDATSMSRARSTLESKNYTVKTLNLAAENKIPDDARAIVVAGPTNPLLDQEVTLIKAYLDKGGSLVVMEDPTPFTKFGTNPDPLADYLKTDWGITLENDVVIDLTSNQPLSAISSSYNSSAPITQQMTTATIMPQSRSLTVSQTPPQNVTVTGLIMTSQQSWGETDLASLQSNQQIQFDQTTDIAGPLTLAASGENSSTNSRIVVFGSSLFATDQGFDVYANGDVFVNSIDWVAEQENVINLTPKQPVQRTFNFLDQFQLIAALLGSICLVPGLVLIGGVSAWYARRKRG